jgi:Fur family transcriptional regulator, ferric uptake regulator
MSSRRDIGTEFDRKPPRGIVASHSQEWFGANRRKRDTVGVAGRPPDAQPHAAKRIGALLQARGLRRTAPRIAVMAALEPVQGHLSVAEIHQRLQEMHPDDAPDLATVYRTVTTLVDKGVLHALSLEGGVTTYGVAEQPHHHAVCIRCGAIIEVPAPQLRSALEHASEGSSFILSDRAGLTLHGLCPNCQHG